jgi:hypothetical protein
MYSVRIQQALSAVALVFFCGTAAAWHFLIVVALGVLLSRLSSSWYFQTGRYNHVYCLQHAAAVVNFKLVVACVSSLIHTRCTA